MEFRFFASAFALEGCMSNLLALIMAIGSTRWDKENVYQFCTILCTLKLTAK